MLKWQKKSAHFSTFGFCHSFVIGHSSFSFEIFIRASHAEALPKAGVSRVRFFHELRLINRLRRSRAGKSVAKNIQNNVDTFSRVQLENGVHSPSSR